MTEETPRYVSIIILLVLDFTCILSDLSDFFFFLGVL
uniref:Uncharacterized protein n=1 Tax=Brassica campestris TaxID=3711 RepID=A0A3P5Y6D1_BRACM|nr:unnamed protein product [Brassica rapa]